ncbi:hypothetical protein IE53DRAFT_364897 [Violaceomyces palustris]|uniref:Uncharacterized protein n=1 Tax=Violaceomyces palustris TaxID=1673888 RepID=A0ACD0NMZ2_9BASI|nr:hypothetical protein IE53DRAFT_364897 [Violaceomyces palustris]
MKRPFNTHALRSFLILLPFVFVGVESLSFERRVNHDVPSDSQLIQFQPCSEIPYTVPMFVSPEWIGDARTTTSNTIGPGPLGIMSKRGNKSDIKGSGKTTSKVRRAIITTHGVNRDPNTAYSDFSDLKDAEVEMLISPGFFIAAEDKSNPFFDPGRNLGWADSNAWVGGSDAVTPLATRCSTYDAYDSILERLSDRSIYPELREVIFAAHSDGAAFLLRYSLLFPSRNDKDRDRRFKVRFVAANSPTSLYFGPERPEESDEDAGLLCPDFDRYPYGLEGTLPRYVQERMGDKVELFEKWIEQDLITLQGTLDTFSRSRIGDQSCSARSQGGENRRDRGYAYFAYRNLLAGTDSPEARDYYGYSQLDSQVKPIIKKERGRRRAFHHRNCVVSGVGHHAIEMYESQCGRAAIKGLRSLPRGSPPLRPP